MGRTREYEGNGIVVAYELRRCIHAAECVKGLPAVFDPDRRPWIQAAEADADAVAEVVRRCPTGALTYRRTDGAPQEAPPEAAVEAVPDGPLHVRGAVELRDHEGALCWTGMRAALCRCGASNNKPFCDNSHRKVGFTTAPHPGTPSA